MISDTEYLVIYLYVVYLDPQATFFFLFFFFTAPAACKRDQNCATAVAHAAEMTIPNP